MGDVPVPALLTQHHAKPRSRVAMTTINFE